MIGMTRRALLKRGTFSVATMLSLQATGRSLLGDSYKRAKFTMSLRCHSIGVSADQRTAIRLAHKHGFESVVPDARFLADLTDDSRAQLIEEMKDKKISWGAAGLPVSVTDLEFRRGPAFPLWAVLHPAAPPERTRRIESLRGRGNGPSKNLTLASQAGSLAS